MSHFNTRILADVLRMDCWSRGGSREVVITTVIMQARDDSGLDLVDNKES
jgi:hypothetical protein